MPFLAQPRPQCGHTYFVTHATTDRRACRIAGRLVYNDAAWFKHLFKHAYVALHLLCTLETSSRKCYHRATFRQTVSATNRTAASRRMRPESKTFQRTQPAARPAWGHPLAWPYVPLTFGDSARGAAACKMCSATMRGGPHGKSASSESHRLRRASANLRAACRASGATIQASVPLLCLADVWRCQSSVKQSVPRLCFGVLMLRGASLLVLSGF